MKPNGWVFLVFLLIVTFAMVGYFEVNVEENVSSPPQTSQAVSTPFTPGYIPVAPPSSASTPGMVVPQGGR